MLGFLKQTFQKFLGFLADNLVKDGKDYWSLVVIETVGEFKS